MSETVPTPASARPDTHGADGLPHDPAPTARPASATQPASAARSLSAAPSALTPLGLFTLLLGAALPMVDFFIVNVAFPSIQSDLNASPAALEMVVASYSVAYAALLVLGGRLGDSHGRRRLFLWGVTAFGVTSLACGLAPDAWSLILARLTQGAASAMMLPQVLATIHATTEGGRRHRAIGLYGSVGGIAMILGQILGGVIVAADFAGSGWRAIFLVNVPVVLFALLLGVRSVPDSRAARPARGDLLGTVLLTAALVALLLPLTEGRAAGWPLWSVALLVAAPFLAWAFFTTESRAERSGGGPLLPPSLLREPGVRRALLAGLPVFLGFSAWMFEIALVLQQGLRFGAMKAGLTLIPLGIGQFTSSSLASRITQRFGAGRVLVLSAVAQGTGLGLVALAALAWWPDLSWSSLAPGLVLCGLGQGLQVATYFRLVLSSVPTSRAGAGSGLAATSQQSCLALGVATLGSLFLALIPTTGMRDALVIVLGVQIVGLMGLVGVGLRVARARDGQ